MSGGHYPPSYHHIQPPQEFLSPRHRLPVIPPQGPPSSTIAHAHSSSASWINKHNFANFHDNPALYTPTTAKNYSSTARSYRNEESGWSEPVSLINPHHRDNSNDKSRINYSNDVQQESMDLSSAAHVPATGAASPKTTVPVNGSPATEETPSVNGSPAKKDIPDSPPTKEPVSVIATNPLREKSTQGNPKKGIKKMPDLIPANKTNDTAESKKSKTEQNIPADHVESILETMFHLDTKSPASTAASVIVSTPPCKSDDFRVESVEKILKSPSPVRSDHLESDLDMNSSEFEFTKDSSMMNSSAIDLTDELARIEDNHDNSRKPSNDSNIEKLPKTVPGKKSDNKKSQSPTNSSNGDNLGLADDSDIPPVSKIDKPEPATDLSCKTEPNDVENPPKKNTASDKKSDTNKTVPGKSKNPPKEEITYVQVETELEKMFAGIEDISIDPSSNDSKPNATRSISNEASTKPAKKKSSKKYKSTTKKDTKKHSINSKDTSTDSVNFKRVPVIHVEGSKENPTNVQIINSIKLEEDDISDAKTAAKRKQGKCDRANKRLAACYSVKNFDPQSSDESWICIFCRLSAYCPGLTGEPTGDLFGPYFIQLGNDSDSKRHSRKTDHLTESTKKKKSKKQKRSLSSDSNHTTSNSSEHRSMEIWAHENCFIWASGVHLVGSKLIGLEEAVIEALQSVCAHCGEKGASIGCQARHCKSLVHYSCALFTGWNLNPETFIAVCYLHKGTQTH